MEYCGHTFHFARSALSASRCGLESSYSFRCSELLISMDLTHPCFLHLQLHGIRGVNNKLTHLITHSSVHCGFLLIDFTSFLS